MSAIILKQTVIMLILMLAGVMCRKTGIISAQTNRDLSKLVLQVVNPAVIFMSYQTELHKHLVRNLLLTFGLSAAAFAVMIGVTYILIRPKEGRETEIERFSAVYSNCGFMGIPLVNAMFGMEGVFYLAAYITVFNLLAWTHGIILISGEKSLRQVVKVFYSPTVIAIALGLLCFFFQIRLPELPAQVMEYIVQLNTPLAMIVSGVSMSDTDVISMLKKGGVYRVCLIKLIILPVILSIALSFLPISSEVRLTILVAASAPPAAMCTLQCLRYGKNNLYSSEIFTAGTIFSAFSLPFTAFLSDFLTKTTS